MQAKIRRQAFAKGVLTAIALVMLLNAPAIAQPPRQVSEPPATGRLWYVSTAGDDLSGDGSVGGPFRTIQHAIDAARDGSTVVVLEGRYAGSGNANLDFRGKAITVISRDPQDDACMRETIIDAEGQGVVVRFVNDEGPDTVFSGFTLLPGDISTPVRGVAGFFEFSANARPTTSRLRVVNEGPIPSAPPSLSLAAEPPYGGRAWDGNNSFHQPAATTDYYGSGDVDADGTLTAADVTLAQDMVDGLRDPSSRADVDGDGAVDANDVSLLNSALETQPKTGF